MRVPAARRSCRWTLPAAGTAAVEPNSAGSSSEPAPRCRCRPPLGRRISGGFPSGRIRSSGSMCTFSFESGNVSSFDSAATITLSLTVSSRFRIRLAAIVQAANSLTSSVSLRFDSPTASSFAAAVLVCLIFGQLLLEHLEQHGQFVGGRRPCGGQPERIRGPLGAATRRLRSSSLGQAPGGLDILHVVHQHQRLQRRVGARTAHGACLRATGRRT